MLLSVVALSQVHSRTLVYHGVPFPDHSPIPPGSRVRGVPRDPLGYGLARVSSFWTTSSPSPTMIARPHHWTRLSVQPHDVRAVLRRIADVIPPDWVSTTAASWGRCESASRTIARPSFPCSMTDLVTQTLAQAHLDSSG